LVDLCRRFDTLRPDAHLEICVVDPEASSLAVAEAMLRQALPAQPDRETEFLAIPRPRKWAPP
jgi:hypothetical protein